ncbi:MAG: hypothetical protein ACYTEQ_03535 [Planctomycetota bacterium]|jgi:hypothetical protein
MREETKNDLPQKLLVTRSEILNSNIGISKGDFAKAIRCRAITPVRTPGKKYAKYYRDDVIKVFCGQKT